MARSKRGESELAENHVNPPPGIHRGPYQAGHPGPSNWAQGSVLDSEIWAILVVRRCEMSKDVVRGVTSTPRRQIARPVVAVEGPVSSASL